MAYKSFWKTQVLKRAMKPLAFLFLALPIAVADARGNLTTPSVLLDRGVFIGKRNNTVAEFLGIPFAQST